MSSALAIAGVTAVLRDLLNDGLINHNVSGVLGSTVTVSARPPDQVVPADGTEATQLNLFLHNVSPNTGWRNEGLPSRDASGRHRLSNPPLALNLHYLLSAYSNADLHGEILLGYAMQLLHDTPVLSRAAIRTALNPSPDVGGALPPALRALADAGLADQIEDIRVAPEFLNSEEMSKLWTAAQSSYRPTAAYLVSVVLIESQQPVRAPTPVLTRGPLDPVSGRERGVVAQAGLVPALPTLDAVVPPAAQNVVRLGESVSLDGHHLDGTSPEVHLVNELFDVDESLTPSSASPTRVQFTIPSARAGDFPVGLYRVAVRVTRPGETGVRESNRLALTLAPDLTGLPLSVNRDGADVASFTLAFTPQLRSGQSVALVLGQQEVLPQTFSAPTASLDFVVADAPVGNHLARLRVDGIDSPFIDREATPPVFLDQRIDIS